MIPIVQLKFNTNNDLGSLVLFTRNINGAAHHLDDVLCDGHAKTRPLDAAYRRRIRPRKRFVNFLQKLVIHPHAVIADTEFKTRSSQLC